MEDDEARRLVKRLARPHRSGGEVVERAAILASGSDSTAVIAWITAHEGTPEAPAAPRAMQGLHASRSNDAGGTEPGTALRYILPPGALD